MTLMRSAALAFSLLVAAAAARADEPAGPPAEAMPDAVSGFGAAPAPSFAAASRWGGGYAGVQLGYGDIAAQGGPLDGNGPLYGLHAGYRWDLGGAVLGIEGDWDRADIDLGSAGTLDSVARLKLSGGADLGPALVYATAGAAWAEATVGGAALSDRGWFLGAGMDYAVTDSLSLGGEVLGHRFSDFDGSGVDIDAATVTARVSLRF